MPPAPQSPVKITQQAKRQRQAKVNHSPIKPAVKRKSISTASRGNGGGSSDHELWVALVSECAAKIGRSAANRKLYLQYADLQMKALGCAGLAEILRIAACETLVESDRAHVVTLVTAAKQGPLINVGRAQKKVCHTYSLAAFNAVVKVFE